jgi:hypothetical protein
MAPLVRLGLFGLGVSLFLDQVRPLVSDAQFTWGERRVMGIVALITLGGFGVASWVVGRLLRAAAELIDLFIDAAESSWRTADLIELQMVPTLARIATALERRGSSTAAVGESPGARAQAIRQALADERFDLAERLLDDLANDFPGAAELAELKAELNAARGAAVDALRRRLDEARRAEDADAIIDARDALTQHLRGDRLGDLDRQVVRWLMNLIQRRVRAGGSGAEVARLAARVVDSFGDTPEAASLRAALPNLRRSAGLCPRCGRPHRGTGEACPVCLAGGAPGGSPLSPAGFPLTEEPS